LVEFYVVSLDPGLGSHFVAFYAVSPRVLAKDLNLVQIFPTGSSLAHPLRKRVTIVELSDRVGGGEHSSRNGGGGGD
jgi:hypothetical protein